MNNSTFENFSDIVSIDNGSCLLKFYNIVDITVSFVAIILNSVVIMTFLCDRTLRNRMCYLIVSLASADFFAALLGIPLGISVRHFAD